MYLHRDEVLATGRSGDDFVVRGAADSGVGVGDLGGKANEE